MSGMICGKKKDGAKVKRKIYKRVERPVMLFGLDTMGPTKRQQAEVEVAELKMLRFSLGVMRLKDWE